MKKKKLTNKEITKVLGELSNNDQTLWKEILEIKLTSFGKHLLSCGKFKPTYYKFFDNDILYDSQYANFEEYSGVAEARIQQDTPSLKLQTSYNDLEKSVIAEYYQRCFGEDLPESSINIKI